MIAEPDLMNVTLSQAIALVRVFNRAKVYETREHAKLDLPMTFEEWVKAKVSPSFDSYIMVEWAGMHLGIEKDGYTHS